jgi:hypothetical protein
MRLLLILGAFDVSRAEQSPAERLIEAGHWKQARSIVETRLREAPRDALSNFSLSQIGGAFGERPTPLAFAEKAVALDGRTAKYHRQLAEVLGVTAQQFKESVRLDPASKATQELRRRPRNARPEAASSLMGTM